MIETRSYEVRAVLWKDSYSVGEPLTVEETVALKDEMERVSVGMVVRENAKAVTLSLGIVPNEDQLLDKVYPLITILREQILKEVTLPRIEITLKEEQP